MRFPSPPGAITFLPSTEITFFPPLVHNLPSIQVTHVWTCFLPQKMFDQWACVLSIPVPIENSENTCICIVVVQRILTKYQVRIMKLSIQKTRFQLGSRIQIILPRMNLIISFSHQRGRIINILIWKHWNILSVRWCIRNYMTWFPVYTCIFFLHQRA